MASYNEILFSTLSRMAGTPDSPVLLDVRIEDDPKLIPGACRLEMP